MRICDGEICDGHSVPDLLQCGPHLGKGGGAVEVGNLPKEQMGLEIVRHDGADVGCAFLRLFEVAEAHVASVRVLHQVDDN